MPTDRESMPAEPFKIITIKYAPGELPECDLGGVDPWLAQNLLFAIANTIWDALPAPEVIERTGP